MGHVEEISDGEEGMSTSPAALTSRDVPDGKDGPKTIAADLPPAMQEARSQTTDELLTHLNRTPLFMTELDETDGDGGTNAELEALKALAYEGTRAEVGENFKIEGNDWVKVKRWDDARQFYSKAVAVLTAPRGQSSGPIMTDGRLDGGEGPAQVDWLQREDDGLTTQPEEAPEEGGKIVDFEEEEKKEKTCLEACYVNRALCNLELKNYGSVNRDCASAIKLNPKNVKAFYRSAQACLALDKVDAAYDACIRGLKIESVNKAITVLLRKVEERKAILDKRERERLERERSKRQETAILSLALKSRNIRTKVSNDVSPDMQDAKIGLQNPTDAKSVLHVPVLFLYPTAAQSDFVKEVLETDSVKDHLDYLLPAPDWDTDGDFKRMDDVECFLDTSEGGLLKIGKKLALGKIFGNDKVELSDGLAQIYIVPKGKVESWVSEMKKRRKK